MRLLQVTKLEKNTPTEVYSRSTYSNQNDGSSHKGICLNKCPTCTSAAAASIVTVSLTPPKVSQQEGPLLPFYHAKTAKESQAHQQCMLNGDIARGDGTMAPTRMIETMIERCTLFLKKSEHEGTPQSATA
jgi:hypothetical protein